jgi:hypothetical protein
MHSQTLNCEVHDLLLINLLISGSLQAVEEQHINIYASQTFPCGGVGLDPTQRRCSIIRLTIDIAKESGNIYDSIQAKQNMGWKGLILYLDHEPREVDKYTL